MIDHADIEIGSGILYFLCEQLIGPAGPEVTAGMVMA
jgi:hypothetical protein